MDSLGPPLLYAAVVVAILRHGGRSTEDVDAANRPPIKSTLGPGATGIGSLGGQPPGAR